MINEETLTNMYDGIINDGELTTKELNGYGFNSKDLSELVEDGVLERIKRGIYSFNSVEDLFNYGKQLVVAKEYVKANQCFKKCYELDPGHIESCFQLLLIKIKQHDYDEAFKYIESIYNIDNQHYNADASFYLYLLNMITNVPEQYKSLAKVVRFDDVRVDFNDKRYDNAQVQNRIRSAALVQKFTVALKQLNNLIRESGTIGIEDRLLRTLLYQASEEQNRVKEKILTMIKREEYTNVITYLEILDKQRGLSIADMHVLQLVKDLNNIITKGELPKIKSFSTDNLFDAIDGKNYSLALSLSSGFIEKSYINPDDNAIHTLLSGIMNRLSKDTVKPEVKETIVQEKIVEQKNEPLVTPANSFADIISFLMKNDLDNSFRSLDGYLNSINKIEYKFLIIDLIKISLMEGDIAFTKPMIVLTYMGKKNYVFDISKYVQSFYESLSQNKFDEARVYLDIIAKSNKLVGSCVLTDGLEQVLNDTEKMLNYKRHDDILNRVDSSFAKTEGLIQTTVSISEKSDEVVQKTDEHYVEKKVKVNPASKVDTDNLAKDFDDESFINGKLKELYQNGIVLLRPMDSIRRKNIQSVVQNIPNVVSFSIGNCGKRQVVLRVAERIEQDLFLPNIIKEGNDAYKEGDYELCISKYRQLLKIGRPNSRIFAKLGLAYMKKFNINLAIDYLTVATELSKQEENNLDYTELIASLKGLIPADDKKPKFRMMESDFDNDLSYNYGIENIEQIAKLVSLGENLNDICTNLGLDENNKCVVALIFAKNCYAQRDYDLGDQYLRFAETTKNKSKSTVSLLNEVRKNKKFYANRVDENNKALILTPKNKKN